MGLKGKFILVHKFVKSLQFFHNHFHELFEDSLYVWISISFCTKMNLILFSVNVSECPHIPNDDVPSQTPQWILV